MELMLYYFFMRLNEDYEINFDEGDTGTTSIEGVVRISTVTIAWACESNIKAIWVCLLS
jgi:hypothetical protein